MRNNHPILIVIATIALAMLACGPLSELEGLESTVEAGSGTLAAEATRLGPTLEAEATNAVATLEASNIEATAQDAAGDIQQTAEAAVPGIEQTLEAAAPGLQATAEAYADIVSVDGTTVRQWAFDASATSEYSASWGAATATGQPDVLPEGQCGDQQGAWASSSSTGIDTLTLAYPIPVVPTQINVVEIYNPGQITTVTVTDINGTTTTVYEGTPEVVEDCPRTFEIPVTGVSDPITQVAITVDQTDRNWNEIDAVQLVGEIPTP